MKPFKLDTFNERLSSAAASKATLLEKFRSRPAPTALKCWSAESN